MYSDPRHYLCRPHFCPTPRLSGLLMGRPEVRIADEPTTALGVTIHAQILELLAEIQAEMGLAVILVTHNMGVVAEICDRVAVMYNGEIVEQADADSLLDRKSTRLNSSH